MAVSTHSRPKAAASKILLAPVAHIVSTHSRPKAAEGLCKKFMHCAGFNTQPPEGGCSCVPAWTKSQCGFNTQPPEGGWFYFDRKNFRIVVSTHSRPKAAEKIQNNP